MNCWPFLTTFILIGVAELGDKTQLLTFAFATRYPVWEVITAVFLAAAVLMGMAVYLGGAVNYYFPSFYKQLAVGVLFIVFGIWIFLGKEKKENTEKRDKNPFWIVFTSFLLAEFGDKTQLAAFTLSAKYGAAFLVWLGATLGMVGVNCLGVFVGSKVGNYLSEFWIKLISASVFLIFGLWTLGELIW